MPRHAAFHNYTEEHRRRWREDKQEDAQITLPTLRGQRLKNNPRLQLQLWGGSCCRGSVAPPPAPARCIESLRHHAYSISYSQTVDYHSGKGNPRAPEKSFQMTSKSGSSPLLRDMKLFQTPPSVASEGARMHR